MDTDRALENHERLSESSNKSTFDQYPSPTRLVCKICGIELTGTNCTPEVQHWILTLHQPSTNSLIEEVMWEKKLNQDPVFKQPPRRYYPMPSSSLAVATLDELFPHSNEEWKIDTTSCDCDEDGWMMYNNHIREDLWRKWHRPRNMPQDNDSSDAWLVEFQRTLGNPELGTLSTPLLCLSCQRYWIDKLIQDNQQLENKVRPYSTFLNEEEREHDPEPLEKRNPETREDDALALEQKSLEAEIARLNLEIGQTHISRKLARKRREEYLDLIRQYNLAQSTYERSKHVLMEEHRSTQNFVRHASETLHRLGRYNVANDMFHIWHDGQFGTINGLRLGRLPSKPVEWVEINAALGQASMLLVTIAEQAHFEFAPKVVLPLGSVSKIRNEDGRAYPLYSDGSFLKRRSFNQGLVLLLECVNLAGKQALVEEPTLKLPYGIQKGKIGDLYIGLGDDEQWTRALKYMLTHLKWLLAWVAKRSSSLSPGQRRGRSQR